MLYTRARGTVSSTSSWLASMPPAIALWILIMAQDKTAISLGTPSNMAVEATAICTYRLVCSKIRLSRPPQSAFPWRLATRQRSARCRRRRPRRQTFDRRRLVLPSPPRLSFLLPSSTFSLHLDTQQRVISPTNNFARSKSPRITQHPPRPCPASSLAQRSRL
ncbi:uncharacterized protein SCHCODRAFT_02202091 [Schizophyllum commune H4-8]|uniref:uncharacterized protein n=1 Tax=Schizophyllum commune (strain H4-8 / FGSC 9210) TaxID=578458 RepID=UPI00215F6317|nr:uncharacterized protein SCHCODRAFT_02202091 [Schizophyllum commune H4-8]KAI5896917.1 hypothetical protein SCHCODRAFT_02202091 [Schizophyllum commune H4-8]